MAAHSAQAALFEPSALPRGLDYEPDFMTPAEEAALLDEMSRQPFREAHFQGYTARRRIVRFGAGDYGNGDPGADELNPALPFSGFLVPWRRRIAQWRSLPEDDFVHALLTEYQPGTPIGWHSDAPQFGIVVGLSLAGPARMRFRPHAAQYDRSAVFTLQLEPRSAYAMAGEVRRHWQHQIPPVKHLRYSITFRTLKNND
jgi:alkylated DNA repair dioxygenase AlkB